MNQQLTALFDSIDEIYADICDRQQSLDDMLREEYNDEVEEAEAIATNIAIELKKLRRLRNRLIEE